MAAEGNRHGPVHARPGLLVLLEGILQASRSQLVRGDCAFCSEGEMSALEATGQPYLFKLRQRAGVKKLRTDRLGQGVAEENSLNALVSPGAGLEKSSPIQASVAFLLTEDRGDCTAAHFFASGHSLCDSGRNASSPGMVPMYFTRSHAPFDSPGVFA